jgi:hypothetical protein
LSVNFPVTPLNLLKNLITKEIKNVCERIDDISRDHPQRRRTPDCVGIRTDPFERYGYSLGCSLVVAHDSSIRNTLRSVFSATHETRVSAPTFSRSAAHAFRHCSIESLPLMSST